MNTNTNTKLPDCIRAERVGHWMHGSESECDANGELAPITWFCCCSERLKLENMDYDTEMYIPVSQEQKDQFLAKHSNCAVTCFNCQDVPVVRAGLWCEKCMWD